MQLLSSLGVDQRRLRHVLRSSFVLACLVVGTASVFTACKEGEKCVGGIIEDGVCYPKCQDDKCLQGNICVENKCMLVCDSHTDCNTGTQDCQQVPADPTLFVCTSNQKAEGFGAGCPFGTECADFAFTSCPDGSACSLSDCGGQPEACVEGKCPDNSNCSSHCSAAECKPLTCLSKGEGDADSYCTLQDCSSDDQCPGGFECGNIRNPQDCTPSLSQPVCSSRKACIKRTQCAKCTSDLDCSFVKGQRCVSIGGDMRCARNCSGDFDCDPDYACTEGACTPRFGSCEGSGDFCEPCQDDEDCSAGGNTVACGELSGGQRACLDYSFPNTCTTDANCPASPSGRRGECLNEEEGLQLGDALYQRCYYPYDPADNKFSCW